MLPKFCNDTIKILRPSLIDERGKLVPDYENTLEIEVTGCFVDTTTSSVDNQGRMQTQVNTTLYAPVDTVFNVFDKVKFGEDTYTLNSDSIKKHGATNRLDHTQVNLIIQEG
ncbi:MAG: hypothetical protein LBI63_01785 [Candidatus Ancillula sp.]|nr:hypothetical protein [Candidatus Ancillula sp.]